MKKLLPILVVVLVLIAFLGTIGFLWQQSREKPVVFEVETPFVADIVNKTVATGSIVPRTEVELKPRVSGVIESIHVEPGAIVERDDLIAIISIIPDSIRLNQAQSQLNTASTNLANAQREFERARALHTSQVISEAELDRARVAQELAEQDRRSARSNLQLIREGSAGGATRAPTEVRSTVPGMVLEVPVKEGESVTESNTFNAGTTIASIADMSDLIFEGWVDESEVGKIRQGMELAITVGAYQEHSFTGTLEYISPKGELREGAVQFEIRASLTMPESIFVRAGLSANADIVLDEREQVLALREGLLQFEEERIFVEIEVGEQEFEERDVTVGLSDGINIEVLSGVDAETQIKRPVNTGA